ncbi:hypothetical protein BDN71DRAFT_1435035 [Pleurotus eryngii]|uniref:Uncharacterized protein n=1 Tax=Pleurotus eryngii TaxID=5323 RepID=A0A9P6DBY0_PLEER|nr:hypothetical protein BDN71DRAFT_1435035 [Pleurotus eryngii]
MSSPKLPPFTSEKSTFIVASTIIKAVNFVQTLTTSTAAPTNVFRFNVKLMPSRAVRLVQITLHEQVYIFYIFLIGYKLPSTFMCSGGKLSHLHHTIDHFSAKLGLNFASSVALTSLNAAANAAVVIQIYDAILNKYPSMAVPNVFWVFVSINPLSDKAIDLYDKYLQYLAKNLASIKDIEGSLRKMQKAINLTDGTNSLNSGKMWSKMETPAMVAFCVQLT